MVNSANAFVATIRATREKTARLKALRLAKEAQVQTEASPAKQTILRPRAPRKIAAL